MADLAYYVNDFTDEVMPCASNLEAWAEWLSKHDDSWPHDIPSDGDTFAASVMRFGEDIVATCREGREWTFSREPDAGVSFLAVRYGEGLGWDAEAIVWPCTTQALREWLREGAPDADLGQTEYVAVAYDEPSVTLVYRAHPPRLLVQAEGA